MAGMYIPYLRGYGFYKGSGFEFDKIRVMHFIGQFNYPFGSYGCKNFFF